MAFVSGGLLFPFRDVPRSRLEVLPPLQEQPRKSPVSPVPAIEHIGVPATTRAVRLCSPRTNKD